MAAWLGMAAGSLALGFMEPGGSFCLNSIWRHQKAAANHNNARKADRQVVSSSIQLSPRAVKVHGVQCGVRLHL